MSFEFKSALHIYLEMKQRKIKKKVTFQVDRAKDVAIFYS